jgi:universal stress protein A
MKRIRNILHPTDFSPGSDAAFRYACDLALDYDASLIVVYAQGPVVPIATEGILVSNNANDLREVAERQLNAIHPTHRAVRFERVYRVGPATPVILETADEYDVDLIVMGTHGRSGIGRLLLGSVTEEVLRKARCPVLTVKAHKSAMATSPVAPVHSEISVSR